MEDSEQQYNNVRNLNYTSLGIALDLFAFATVLLVKSKYTGFSLDLWRVI